MGYRQPEKNFAFCFRPCFDFELGSLLNWVLDYFRTNTVWVSGHMQNTFIRFSHLLMFKPSLGKTSQSILSAKLLQHLIIETIPVSHGPPSSATWCWPLEYTFNALNISVKFFLLITQEYDYFCPSFLSSSSLQLQDPTVMVCPWNSWNNTLDMPFDRPSLPISFILKTSRRKDQI